ncbi:hypothetical protein TSOC_006120 [Tetrabaena socialis]|uniref:Uncharacterized protein n=1 Tax=Tetrabaena socialis TaxID=47790 RepID=A0A2J8A4I1_9CHLO|nr:hypothetical protein TSOC_006120 [Tetrabaena socialis]|eukprot:PNH07418.1 hypothetical protein TSOC_006120 [Tetrabaena socialis]
MDSELEEQRGVERVGPRTAAARLAPLPRARVLGLLPAAACGVLVTSTVWSRPWLAAKNSATDPATQITKLSYKVLDGTEA